MDTRLYIEIERILLSYRLNIRTIIEIVSDTRFYINTDMFRGIQLRTHRTGHRELQRFHRLLVRTELAINTLLDHTTTGYIKSHEFLIQKIPVGTQWDTDIVQLLFYLMFFTCKFRVRRK